MLTDTGDPVEIWASATQLTDSHASTFWRDRPFEASDHHPAGVRYVRGDLAGMSRRQRLNLKWRQKWATLLGRLGMNRFFMVAAVEAGEMSEEDEARLKPHRRHGAHKGALREAHRLAREHGQPFVVLGVCGLALPDDEQGETA